MPNQISKIRYPLTRIYAGFFLAGRDWMTRPVGWNQLEQLEEPAVPVVRFVCVLS